MTETSDVIVTSLMDHAVSKPVLQRPQSCLPAACSTATSGLGSDSAYQSSSRHHKKQPTNAFDTAMVM